MQETILTIFWICYFFMLGAAFASFYNVVGIRVLDHESILRTSRCPKCQHNLRFIDVIPLLGYTINLGKCHYCKVKIPIKYLLIELSGGFLYALTFYLIGFNYEILIYFSIIALIMITTVSYYEHHIILKKVVIMFLLIMIILLIPTINNIFDFYLIFGGFALSSLFCSIVSIINNHYRKYILYTGVIGLTLGLFGSIIMILLYLIIKLFTIKVRFNYLYIIAFTSMIGLFLSTYHDEIRNLFFR